MRDASAALSSARAWGEEPLGVVLPPGVYDARPLPSAPPSEAFPTGRAAAAAEPPAGSAWAPRASAAERALARLQKENDALKRAILGYKSQQKALQGVVRRLRAELEAMGATVMAQNATLGALSYTAQRRDPCRLVQEKRRARAMRDVVGDGGGFDRVEALQTEAQLLQRACKEKDAAISNLKRLLSKAQKSQARVPETIDTEESEGTRALAPSGGAVRPEANPTEALHRMVAALNRLLDRYEGSSNPAHALAQRRNGDDNDEVAEDEIFTVGIRVLSCADLTYPRDLAGGFNSNFRLFVVVYGPFGRNVLFKTPPEMAHTAFPMFSNDPLNKGRFRVSRDVFGRLELELWAARGADLTVDPVLLGRTSVPVNALLSNSSKGSRPPTPSAVEDGQLTSLYTMKILDPAKEQQVVGEICFEVEIHSARSTGRLSIAGMPVEEAPVSDSPNPQATTDVEKPNKEVIEPPKAIVMPSSLASSGTTSSREVLRVLSDNIASSSSAVDGEALSHRSNTGGVPPEAAPEPPTGGTQATEPLLPSSEVPHAHPSPSVSLYIYIKEAYRFAEDSEDEMLEEFVDYITRVLVWIDEELIFTVPEARGHLRMRWGSGDAAFITAIEPNQTIRFEVHTIRSDSVKGTISEASVKVSDLLSTTERSTTRKLPVMRDGLQCSSLLVEFCKSSK